ncbi:hypothetical protein HD806DRAFT_510458 [Xylariaceae sp. AK1471]|nr:hypothetical protein HD806DRAFT_510458 [Xylariaceae sp. AK1471]
MAAQYRQPTAEDDLGDFKEREGQGGPFTDLGNASSTSDEDLYEPRTQDQSHDDSAPKRKQPKREYIYLKHATGGKFTFPFRLAKTWHGMEKLIEQATDHNHVFRPFIEEGHYDLVGLDGHIVLPSTWEEFVQPGWSMTMQMQNEAQNAKRKEEAALEEKARKEAKAKAEDAELRGNKPPISFKDAVGRKFSFPFHMVKTWGGVEDLIKTAFLHVDVIGPHVQAGHYDLVGPNGEIILPQIWDKVIEPGWSVTMHMWPMERPAPGPGRPRFGQRPGLHPGPRPYGMHGTQPPPPPFFNVSHGPRQPLAPPGLSANALPLSVPHGARDTLTTMPVQIQKPSKGQKGVLSWMVGGGKTKKKKADPNSLNSTAGETANLLVKQTTRPIKNQPLSTPQKGPASLLTDSEASKKSENPDHLDQSDSDATSDTALDIRQEAQRKDLIVVCKLKSLSIPQQRPMRRQTFRPSEQSVARPRRLRIESAQVYCESSAVVHSAPLELVQRLGSSPALDAEWTRNKQLTWSNFTRNSMNFREFEDIALHDLGLDNRNHRLVQHLIEKIKSKWSDEGWYKPGTVLRCDADTEDVFDSVIFVSLPTLHSSSYDSSPVKGEGVCCERKLQEALDQISTPFDQGTGWYSKRTRMTHINQSLWVRQMWVLLAGSSILTYSNFPKETLDADNITIQDYLSETEDGDRIIQVMHQDRRLLYIPSSKCKSFYELQVAVIGKLVELGMKKDEVENNLFHLHLPNGQELSARKWITILKQRDIPLIRVSLESTVTDDSSLKSSISSKASSVQSNTSDGSSDDSISLDEFQEGNASEHELEFPDTEVKERGFLLLGAEPTATRSEFNLPELNRKAPPFFGWLSSSPSGTPKEMHRGFKEAIVRTESKLIRVDGKAYTDNLMEDLYNAYNETDVYQETEPIDFEEFKRQRANLWKGKAAQKSFSASNQSDDDSKSLALEYFDASLLVLESFIPNDFSSRLTSKFLGSLGMIIKDPALNSYFSDMGADSPDPDFPDEATHEKKSRWVVSRKRIFENELQNQVPRANDKNCKACERGIVYHSMESAVTHLQRVHMLHSKPAKDLHHYLLPIPSALEERLREEHHEVFKSSRDSMLSVLRKLISIQDGVVYDDEFRERRGLPYELLEAFKWIFVFACAVPRTLHEITWLYKDHLSCGHEKSLASSKIQRQKQMLLKVSSTIEDFIRKAERALMSPTSFFDDENPKSFIVSVGPHYLATKILCNILRMPIHNHKRVVDLYETHTKNLWSQILRYPNKRHILSVGALRDELYLIRSFHEWQKETLSCIDLVINPDTYPRGFKHEERRELAAFEYELIQLENRRLEKEIFQIEQLLESCDRMISQVRELTDIMKDDQGRAIFIFTTVTVIFLPLGFVATYISMSGDTTGLDWGGRQRLFWETAGPLTIGVLIFCLGVARMEDIVGALPVEWVEKMVAFQATIVSKIRYNASRDWDQEENEEVENEVSY